MSKLSDNITRDRYIHEKGHYGHNVDRRNIVQDRSKPKRRVVTISDTEDKGDLQYNLLQMLGGIR